MLVFFTFWSTCYSIGNTFSQDIIGGVAFKRPNWIGQNSLTSKKRIVCFQLYLYLYFLNTSWKSKLELDLTERRVAVTIDRVVGIGNQGNGRNLFSPTLSPIQSYTQLNTDAHTSTHKQTQLNTDEHTLHTVELRGAHFTHS